MPVDKPKTDLEKFAKSESVASQFVDSSLDGLKEKINKISDKEKQDQALAELQKIAESFGTPGYTYESFKESLETIFSCLKKYIKIPVILKEATGDESITTLDSFLKKYMTKEIFEKKNAEKTEEIATAKKAKEVREKEQGFNLSRRQRSALRAIKDIGSIVSKIESDGGTEEVKKAKLLSEVKKQVSVVFMQWIDVNSEPIERWKQTVNNDIFYKKINEQSNYKGEKIKLNGAVGLHNIEKKGGDALRFVKGQQGFSPMSENGLLRVCFSVEKQTQIALDLIGENGQNISYSDYEKIAESAVDKLFENKSFADIKKHFHQLNPKQGSKEHINEDAKIVYEKLLTVGKSWRKSKWEKGYIEYVKTAGSDAYEFDEWLNSDLLSEDEKPDKLTKLMNWFKDMFGDLIESVKGFWNKEEKAKQTEQQRIGTAALKYKKMAGLEEEEIDKPDEKKDSEVDAGMAREDFGKLSALLKESKIKEPLNIKVDGTTLDLKDVSSENQAALQSIESFMKKDEFANARVLLTKGLKLEDLAFLVEHNGDQNADGINVEFGEDGFEMSYDFQGFLKSFDFEGEAVSGVVGAVGAGLGVTALGFSAPILVLIATVLGAGAVALGANKFEEIMKLGNTPFKYSKIDPTELKSTIFKMKEKVGELEKILKEEAESIVKNFSKYKDYFDENITEFPPDLFKNREFSDSLISLFERMKVDNSHEKLSDEDLKLLDQYFKEEKGGESGYDFKKFTEVEVKKDELLTSMTYKDVYMESKEYKDPNNVGKPFLHVENGGRGLMDDNFENLAAFFDYLKNN